MPTVLLTRPRKESEKLASRLAALGYLAMIEPLLEIVPLDVARPALRAVGATMITSANALTALEVRGDRLADLLDVPCFCVGPQTAEAARVFGFRDVRAGTGDGAALAEMIAHDMKGAKKPVLHIAGRDTTGAVPEILRKRRIGAVPWTVYAARATGFFAPQTLRAFQEEKLDAVTVFSVRTAATLAALIERHGLKACCANLSAIGISEAVIDRLRHLPWRHLAAAKRPDEESVIERLQELMPHD